MKREETLYARLIEAYQEASLNRLALELISLYKNEQYGSLRRVAEIISPWQKIEITEDGRGFARFMMLYHPDKGAFYRQQITDCFQSGRFDGMAEYTHILRIIDIDELKSALADADDIDYSPVYEWDFDPDSGYHVEDEDGNEVGEERRFFRIIRPSNRLSFFDALKLRVYGDTEMELPIHYLHDLDEFELAESGICDLEGVQHCIHASTMDLSGNEISDLSLLWGLTRLEVLNLAENDIEDIGVLRNLVNLRSLNLSNNRSISDLSPLFGLDSLEYLELTGVRIPHHQLSELQELGIAVIT